MEKLKRNTLKTLLVMLVSSIEKFSYSNGNPYRDRFQSYRQTFRIEPNPIETERIINNIIGGKKKTKNLVDLQVPDTVEDGNVVPLTLALAPVTVESSSIQAYHVDDHVSEKRIFA